MKKMGKAVILSSSLLLAGTTLSMVPSGTIYAEAASSLVKFSKTSYQTTSNLNLRSGAGTKYKKLMTIPKGKKILSSERIGKWYKVSYSYASKGKSVTKTGWVDGSYLKEYYLYSTIGKTYFFTKGTAKLHSAANPKSKVFYNIGPNNGFYSTQKVVNSIGQTWYRISYKGKTYYLNSSDVSKQTFQSFSETKYKTNTDTYLYSAYGTIYTKLVKIPKNTLITSKQRIGNWFNVTFNGKTGFVYSGHVGPFVIPSETIIEISKNFLTTNDLNLYQFADSGAKVMTTIPKGTKVTPTHATENGWYKVSFEGKIGYLLATGLQEEVPEPPPVEDSVSEEPVSKKFIVTVNLNLREKPSVDSAVRTVIPKDTTVSPTSVTTNGWYKLSYNGEIGYVLGTYLQEAVIEDPSDGKSGEPYTEEKLSGLTYLIKANLNVRMQPDASSNTLTTIPQGEIVIPTYKTSTNWYKVEYNGKTGYVSGSYVEQVKTGDPIYSRDSYQFIDLRTQSQVTAAQINAYIGSYIQKTGKATVLSDKGQVFIDVGKKYGVNALYLAAHAIHESGFGTSLISLGKYNLFGFGAFDATPFVGAIRFSTIDSSIDYIAREMKSTYLNPGNWKFKGAYLGFSTKTMSNSRIDANSEGMNFYYASDENWGKTIAKHMQNILPYDKAYYDKATVNLTVPARPTTPDGSDIFPSGIVAKAKKDIVLDSKKGTDDKVKIIKSGSQFTMLEKTNDYWVRVKVDGLEYWTNDIRFDLYSSFISVLNLGRNTVSSLNIRSGAGTSYSVIGSYSLNDYVEIVLNSDGTTSMNSDKTWYQVKLSNGTKGWVYASYIKRELP